MNSFTKRLIGALVVLIITGLGVLGYRIANNADKHDQQRARYEAAEAAKIESAEAKRLAIEQQQVAAKNAEDEAFTSNMESWQNHPNLGKVAQFTLADDPNRVIRTIVEQSFTNYDPIVVAVAANMIHRIGGESALQIVLGYKNDPRVVVSENVKWYYNHYNPGAMDDRIEAVEVKSGVKPAYTTHEVLSQIVREKPAKSAEALQKEEELQDDIQKILFDIQDYKDGLTTCRRVMREQKNEYVRRQAETDIKTIQRKTAQSELLLQKKRSELAKISQD